MLDTNPKPYIIAGILTIILFFGGILAWSAFLPFYGAVIAPGIVKIAGHKKIIQHLEGGIVDKVLIKDGDKVKKGQVLITLKSAKINAQLDLLQGKLYFKLAELARLRAESMLAQKIDWPQELITNQNDPKVFSVIKEENAIFNSRRTDLLNKISLYRSQIIQLKKQKKGLQARLKAQKQILAALKDELTAKEDLFRQKYIDKTQILELRRKVAEAEGTTQSLVASIAQVEQRIEEFQLRILDLKNTYKENAIAQSRKVLDEIFSLREQLRPLLDAKKRLQIVSPIDGTVINLRVHPESVRVIRAGEPLMEIVPENSEMIIEARIRPDEITKVYKGQMAKVQLSAFDRRVTPPIPGKVIYVSADQVTQNTSHGVRAFYIAHIQINENDLKQAGAYLYPGMPAVCYLTTKKRTILSYLLAPLLETADKALRE